MASQAKLEKACRAKRRFSEHDAHRAARVRKQKKLLASQLAHDARQRQLRLRRR